MPDINPAAIPKFRLELVAKDKESHLPLLLQADPDVTMIRRYLPQSDLYVAKDQEQALGAAVIEFLDKDHCELKNFAVREDLRGRGIGSAMLLRLAEMLAPSCRFMLVGTAEPALPFYRRLGFRYSHTIVGFFSEHYPEPVFDGDFLCRDMIVLKKALQPGA